MKNSIIAGTIAGFVSSVVMAVFEIGGLYKLFSTTLAGIPINIQTMLLYTIIYGVISGIIWGVFYAFFYDYIPSKGVKKGLIYGIIIWIISPIHNAGAGVMYGYFSWAIPYAIATFFSIGIVYGIVLGYLYKPPK